MRESGKATQHVLELPSAETTLGIYTQSPQESHSTTTLKLEELKL